MTKRNKYNAQRTLRGGMWFDSKAEAGYADVLELLKKAGEILDWEYHPPAVKMSRGAVRWRVDFKVTDRFGSEFYVEVKGMKTEGYTLKLARWRHEVPAPLFVVKKYGDLHYRVIEEVGTEGLIAPIETQGVQLWDLK